MTPRRREDGAGAALALGVIGAVVLCSVLVAAIAVVLEARRRAVSAADSAALAGADTALGLAVGFPCRRAEETARAAGAVLASCEQHGVLVRVRTVVRLPLLPLPVGPGVQGVAVAGPPP